ncbi:MAG: hypothetical protein ACJ8HJ_25540 [Massilia sp.]
MPSDSALEQEPQDCMPLTRRDDLRRIDPGIVTAQPPPGRR